MELAELLALLLGDSPDLSGLSDEDLATYEQTLIDAFAERRPTARGEEALAELGQIADAADVIRGEAAARIDAAIAEDEAIAAIEARLTPPVEAEEEVEGEAVTDTEGQPEAVEETAGQELETVTAGAVAPARTRPRLAPLGTMHSDAPPAATQPQSSIVILSEPQRTVDRLAVAEAFIEADQYLGQSRMGATVYQPVVKVRGAKDPSRHLMLGNQAHNDSIIAGMWGRAPLLAAGGFCGPSTPYYNMAMISSASTPVSDGLGGPTLNGNRGSVTFNRPLALTAFADAIGQWTNDDSQDPDADPKPCVTVTCTGPVTEEVRAFTHCLTIDNFMDRFSPEMVAQAVDLTMVNFAMERETWLLDRIKASDKAVTVDNVIGAAADINYTVGLAAAGYRNSDRMLADIGLRALLPAWVLDMYIGDIARADHNYAEQLRYARQQVEANLANLGVRPIFYIDTPSTGTSQKFAAQGNGALNPYPSVIQWALFHEGAHAHINGGPELNFGVVRDAAGNRANTYQAFGESFEGYAFLGVKSWWITQQVCPSGTFSAATDLFSDLCGAS